MSAPPEAIFAGVEAVVFDFDGVILESGPIKTRAFLELFAEYPEHLEAIRRHHLENLAISRFVKFEWIYRELLGRQIEATESKRLGERFTSLVYDKVVACTYVPGAREALEALRGVLPTFVASGTPEEELRDIVAAKGLTSHFQGVFGSPATKPTILRKLLRELRLTPGDLLFVGDGRSDWEAAKEVGTLFLARETPEQSGWLERVRDPRVDDLLPLPGMLGISTRSR